MANITSAQDGEWNIASTWTGGAVPTSVDKVTINHNVTIEGNAIAGYIFIGASGSLMTSSTSNMSLPSTLTVTGSMIMDRTLEDNRTVRLDGINLVIGSPSISSRGTGTFPPTLFDIVNTQGQVIIDDTGVLGYSAKMQDISPEGCARAYANKLSNGVRYMNLTVHIRKDLSNKVGLLYRMAENPYQVLAVTNSAVIKGFIEAITPLDSVGKEYRAFRVSIAEGPHE